MSTGLGNYLRTRRSTLFARVGIEFTANRDGALEIFFAPSAIPDGPTGQSPQWVTWRRAVERGVRLGARVAKAESGTVQVTSMVASPVDTTEGSMLGAGALALWELSDLKRRRPSGTNWIGSSSRCSSGMFSDAAQKHRRCRLTRRCSRTGASVGAPRLPLAPAAERLYR